MIDVLNESLVLARNAKGRLNFLCARCGGIHAHGIMNGHRVSHCRADEVQPLGEYYQGYELIESDQRPGRLQRDEATTAHTLSKQALRLVENIRRYLDLADVDPTSRASVLLLTAEKALQDLSTVGASENPFEEITDDGWVKGDEND